MTGLSVTLIEATMRDDIFKGAAVPRAVRMWAKKASREADRRNGRSLAAFEAAVHAECNREISPRFCQEFRRIRDRPEALALLDDPIPWIHRPSGDGGPLEDSVRTAISQFLESGRPSSTELVSQAIECLALAMRDRMRTYIREIEAKGDPVHDPVMWRMIDCMRADAASTDYRLVARRRLLNGQNRSGRPKAQPVSPDEDLSLGRSNGRPVDHE